MIKFMLASKGTRSGVFGVLLLVGCSDPFQYHPWEVEVPDDRHDLNTNATASIRSTLSSDSSTFDFAVIGDPQAYYDEFDEVLGMVTGRTDLDFAIVVGDLTDQALLHEFGWYADRLESHHLPVVSIIGNHDHLGNGRVIYERMFGARNFTFHAGGVRFVMFDNVEWESEIPVDYGWLDVQLAEPHAGHTLVFMHIQPTDVQLEGTPGQTLDAVMEARRPEAVFMGHLHGYATDRFTGGTPWATAPWCRARAYLHVRVRPDTVMHELVYLP